MAVRVDHIVILVDELAAAVKRYNERGFTVVPGGEHTDGATHNALVILADGSYLELIAFMRAAPEHRWWRQSIQAEQLVDWALLPDNIEAQIAQARERGVAYRGPIDGGRLRPDGQQLRWQTGVPPSPDLPFLCADLTPRALRVPSEHAYHANGATGIASITVGAADVWASAQQYTALLGREPEHASAEETAFTLGETQIVVRPSNGSQGILQVVLKYGGMVG